MLKTTSSFVLSRLSPCDVPKGYDSVAGLPAALLEDRFEHPTGNNLRDEASGGEVFLTLREQLLW